MTIKTVPVSLIAEYLGHLHSITEKYAANDYSTLWRDLLDKIMDIYPVIKNRFDNFNWEAEDEGYDSYKDECEDFITSFIDFAATECEEDLLPSFDEYVKNHN